MTKELVGWKRPLSLHYNDVGNSKMRIKPKQELRFNLIIFVLSLSQPWPHNPSFLFLLFWDRLWLRSRKKRKGIPNHLSFVCVSILVWLLLLSCAVYWEYKSEPSLLPALQSLVVLWQGELAEKRNYKAGALWLGEFQNGIDFFNVWLPIYPMANTRDRQSLRLQRIPSTQA